MARRNSKSLLQIASDMVAKHPQLAAALAFQVGALAAKFVTNAPRAYKDLKREASDAPGRIMAAMPAISALMSESPTPKRRPKRRKSASRKRVSAKRAGNKAPLHPAPATTH